MNNEQQQTKWSSVVVNKIQWQEAMLNERMRRAWPERSSHLLTFLEARFSRQPVDFWTFANVSAPPSLADEGLLTL